MPDREHAEGQNREPAGGRAVIETPLRPSDPESPSGATGAEQQATPWSGWASSPVFLAIVGCVALAALSAAVLPTVPSYDPWAWIVWGREIVDPHLSFATGGGPSWKPLPVFFTTVYGLFGGAAPTLWVITARAGGLLALVAAYRLGARFAGWIAGVVAVLGVLLTQDWFYYMFRGTSEPMLVGASLWAIERHLAGRRGQAFSLTLAAALIRPEAWPFLGLYALWLWFAEPRLRVLLVAGIAAVPFFWFVPPWIGSGQPFLAASHAKAYNGHLGNHPSLEALRRAGDLQILPVLIAAAIGVAIAWFKDRDRVVVGLAVGALAWVVLVVAMVVAGYPGLERFFLPAAGVFCVLAGIGVARVAGLAGGGAATVGLAALLLAISIPLATSRISTASAQKGIADRAVKRLDELSSAVRAVGGTKRVFPCHSSFTAVNHGVQTALAWKLQVTLGRVGTTLRHQGLTFVGPHDSIDGGPAAVRFKPHQEQLIARVGGWRVYRVTRPGASVRCVGT
jgi:hypothetical protein